MKLVHYLQVIRLEHGGVVRAVLDMCPALAAAGHEVVLLCCDPHDAPAAWRGESRASGLPRIEVLPAPSPALGLPSGSAFRRAVRTALEGADALHLHGVWDLPECAVAAEARRHNIPYGLSPHGMLDDWAMSRKVLKKKIALHLLVNRMLRRASFIHCAASGELAEASKWFPRHLGRIAPLPFDLAEFHQLPGPGPAAARWPALAGDHPRILFLSRLVENKGAHHIVGAMPAIRRAIPNAQLYIAGSGDPACESALHRQVAELGLDDTTHFLGHVGGVEKISLLQSCDVFILPTIHENFGFAILEAMAAGTPVITTQGAKLWRELQEAGVRISDPTPEAIASQALPLLSDLENAAALGEQCRHWVLDFLDPARVTAGLESLYSSSVSPGPASSPTPQTAAR